MRGIMIRLPGVLTIRIVAGRYGDFRVGRLITGIGEFSVKDAVLDQYLEGSYEGVFGVSRIYPTHYSAGGRLIIEVRAEVQAIALSNINPLEQYDPLLEQDPIEDDKVNKPLSNAEPFIVPVVIKPEPANESDSPYQSVLDAQEPDSESSESQQAFGGNEVTNPDEKLFGLLWPLSEQIKLDATVDRNVFRQQRDRLKALGYSFKPVGQLWTKP